MHQEAFNPQVVKVGFEVYRLSVPQLAPIRSIVARIIYGARVHEEIRRSHVRPVRSAELSYGSFGTRAHSIGEICPELRNLLVNNLTIFPAA